MLIDYTYVVDSVKRQKDKKGKVKEERITYEVFIPTLKRGARTRGVLVVTSRNQVPVPPGELEKERLQAAERIEKEENKIARETPASPALDSNQMTGTMPVGMYTRNTMSREAFGVRRGAATLAVNTFLKTSDYPKLFYGITTETTATYSNYIRFSAEVGDVKVGTPSNP